MSQHDEHTNQFGAEDFERYYSGMMTKQEMHALEKAALEDPFLGDALEGYAYTPTPIADIGTLRAKLAQKEEWTKVIWFSMMRPAVKIAAVFLLLAGFSWLVYQNTGNAHKEIANNTTAKDTAAKQSPLLAGRETAANGTMLQDAEIRTAQVNKQAPRNVQDKPDNSIHQDLALNDANIPSSSWKYTAPEKPSSQNDKTSYFKDKKADSLDGTFASTTIPKNKSAAEINEETNTAAADAYRNKQNVPRALFDTMINVVLEPSQETLSEVVVTSAYKKNSRKETATRSQTKTVQDALAGKVAGVNVNAISRIVIENAIPLQGWAHFNKYVNDSLRTAQQLNVVPMKLGAVLLSFNVNKQGHAADIKVKRPLCIPCDAEAIRILQEGPLWKQPVRHKKAKATIIF
jgi:hypothetical protein